MNWGTLVQFVHRWQWLLAELVAGAPALYYGPRKALETWEWYVLRFRDEPILQLMRDCKLVPAEHNMPVEQQIGPSPPNTRNTLIMKEGTYSVGDLAYITNRSRTSIGKFHAPFEGAREGRTLRGGFRLK